MMYHREISPFSPPAHAVGRRRDRSWPRFTNAAAAASLTVVALAAAAVLLVIT